MRFAFVVSSSVHVSTFRPLQRALQQRGAHEFLWISLDEWYRWGAREALARADIDPIVLPGPPGGERFVHLGLPRMYFELIVRARREIRAALTPFAPDVVVVCNDRGLIEKELLRQAKALGAATLMIIEGVLWRSELRRHAGRFAWTGGARERALTVAKEALAIALNAVGRPELAPSYLGQGGCDAIAAPGSAQRRLLLERGVDPARIFVTGQPRFDAIRVDAAQRRQRRRELGLPPGGAVVALFTSGFGTQRLTHLQRRQEALVEAVVRQVADRHGEAVTLAFKPHPRESIEPYRKILSACPQARVMTGCTAHELLAISDLAITPPSTIIVEAALTCTPIVIAQLTGDGTVGYDLGLHAGALTEANDFGSIGAILDTAVRGGVRSQLTVYADDLAFVPPQGAAAGVAELALAIAVG